MFLTKRDKYYGKEYMIQISIGPILRNSGLEFLVRDGTWYSDKPNRVR